ncbi:NUDIX domain-containing protein [Fulvivirga sedimenti]|uniref:GDP-mannose pyrophosphatase n=1 Tax=Fulvivirga sedimenti TaxID=2879465 RepID=A0A9X1HU78_9BACT|nr:NUDIX hydrolase [Fulvivirga sedimenti]MCA6078036.1 NUDIX hydrolase [Fulvivirga sedimenti]
MSDKNNPWKRISSTEIYSNPWITVTEDQVINPGGGKGIYGKVHFKNIALGIIPLDDEDNTWLVGQYRYPLDRYSWEIPEGGGPENTDPLESAKRELREETGITADSWEKIITLHTSNSVTDEIAFVYLATHLSFGQSQLEESETDLVLKKVHLREALEMVLNHEITDSISMAGILKAARLRGY